jgi:hypothetical protein
LVTWYKNRASVDNLTGAAYNCSCFPFWIESASDVSGTWIIYYSFRWLT